VIATTIAFNCAMTSGGIAVFTVAQALRLRGAELWRPMRC
jgi:hypothetical protein